MNWKEIDEEINKCVNEENEKLKIKERKKAG